MDPAHVNGSSEHIKEKPEVKHDDDKPPLDLEVKHEDNKPRLEPDVKHDDDKPILDLEVKHEDDKPRIEHDNKHDDDKPLQVEHSRDSSSLSRVSSSSSSSLEFEIDEKDHLDDGNLSSGPEYVSSPDISNQTPQWSMMSTSPRATMFSTTDLSPAWSMFGSSQIKSPLVQTMGKSSGYDPNRIPASVFSSRPTNPTEWSVASNESLFSIHMGNNSFSGDQAILFGKPGDPWYEDWNNPPSNLPPVMEVPSHEESSVRSGKDVNLEREDSDKRSKASSERTSEDRGKETIAPAEIAHPSNAVSNAAVPDGKENPPAQNTLHSSSNPRSSSSTPRASDGSGHSGNSFAFPVLVGDAGKSSSLNAVSETMDKSQAASKPTPEDPETKRWLSCFSCWPRCC